MAISQRTSTLVWNRARGLCSICRADLVDVIGSDPRITGERAHITARSPDGPRYDATLTDDQRDDYANLMLLCGLCHTKVDTAPDHYTVAMLHSIKSQHEEYCIHLLTVDDEQRAIKGEILANAVDTVVAGISLDGWDAWTSRLLGPGKYLWPSWALKEFRYDIRPAIYRVLWPEGVASLEISTKMLIDAVVAFSTAFSKQSGSDTNYPGYLVCDSITSALSEYRRNHRDPNYVRGYMHYERELKHWDATLELGLIHMAKAANWFADAVREHVNPRFRILEGAFVLEAHTHQPGDFGVWVFSNEEKQRAIQRGYRSTDPDVWQLVADIWNDPPEPPDRRIE